MELAIIVEILIQMAVVFGVSLPQLKAAVDGDIVRHCQKLCQKQHQPTSAEEQPELLMPTLSHALVSVKITEDNRLKLSQAGLVSHGNIVAVH